MKIAYIIIMLILFVGYNIFFNKKKGGGYTGRNLDLGRILYGLISFIIYLISWIVWFIIF